MQNLILACVGFAIAIAGLIYLARLLYLKKFGVAAKAEILRVRESPARRGKPSGAYIHTVRYTVNGKTYEEQDRAGYSEPLKVGSTHLLMCDPNDAKRFKFEADLDSHIKVAAALIAAGVIFAGRFMYAYIK